MSNTTAISDKVTFNGGLKYRQGIKFGDSWPTSGYISETICKRSNYGTLIGSHLWFIELHHCQWQWVTFGGHFICWKLLYSQYLKKQSTLLRKNIITMKVSDARATYVVFKLKDRSRDQRHWQSLRIILMFRVQYISIHST